MPTKKQLARKKDFEKTVGEAMIKWIEEETSASFSYVLVPSKKLADGGLGATWPGWHALLVELVARYLPQEHPYLTLVVDVILVDTTYNKNLRSLRYWLVEHLVLIELHNV